MLSLRRTPAARRSFGTMIRASAAVRSHVEVSRTSSTTPDSPSNVTWSPMRRGWVIARMSPAIALAIVCRAAKPTMAAAMALEASTVSASRPSAVNCESAVATPTSTITASITRRRKRSRVSATGESSPPATRAAIVRP
jgi:hypothetical protein